MLLNKTTLGVEGFRLYTVARGLIVKGPISLIYEDPSGEREGEFEWYIWDPEDVGLTFFVLVVFFQFEVTGIALEV